MVEIVVRPVSLDFPVDPIVTYEPPKVHAHLSAFSAPESVVPRISVRIRTRLGQFMSSHIGQGFQPLGLPADVALRVASRITIQLEEEANLIALPLHQPQL